VRHDLLKSNVQAPDQPFLAARTYSQPIEAAKNHAGSSRIQLTLQHQPTWVFNGVFDPLQEGYCFPAINKAVIV
jgi:hypothetical protein